MYTSIGEEDFKQIKSNVLSYCTRLSKRSYSSYESAKSFIKRKYPDLDSQQYSSLIKIISDVIIV